MLACLVAISIASVAPAAVAPPVSPPTAQGGLSASTIFARARLAMYLRTYPRYVAYVIDIQSDAYGRHYHEGYRALLRTHDRALVVKQDPIYTSNQPPNPYGFSFFGINKEGKPSDHIEPPFGVPWMSALYDFDLARPPVPKAMGPPAGANQTRERILGLIAVTGGDYDVSLAGIEDDEGVDVYHLTLSPLHDPDRNRVRDLWVDVRTFAVRRLVSQGIFLGGPATLVPWDVRFIQLHGYWFIRTESTSAVLRAPAHVFGGSAEYRGIRYTFGLYEYPRLISDLEFTPFGIDTDAVQM